MELPPDDLLPEKLLLERDEPPEEKLLPEEREAEEEWDEADLAPEEPDRPCAVESTGTASMDIAIAITAAVCKNRLIILKL